MKCFACGAESAEATPICVRCGTPTATVRTLQPEPLAVAESVQHAPPEPVGQQAAPRFSVRRFWVALVLGLLGVVIRLILMHH